MITSIQKHKFFWLLVFFLLVTAVGFFGSMATQQSLDPWYKNLSKPDWTPPAWVFPIAWTFLYFLIAVAGWLIWIKEPSSNRTKALLFYFGQLFLNGLWSFVFFYFQNPPLALIEIIVLAILIGLTIKYAWPVSKWASLLLIPYLIWVTYATALNANIVGRLFQINF